MSAERRGKKSADERCKMSLLTGNRASFRADHHERSEVGGAKAEGLVNDTGTATARGLRQGRGGGVGGSSAHGEPGAPAGASPAGRRPAVRHSKLDAYKPEVDRLLAAGVWNAVVILRELQERDYSGQVSILRNYIRPKRPLRQARATVRFETAAGEQLQNDWAKYRTLVAGREQEVHFAVNTLGYSRRFHFVAMACDDAEHTYESQIHSFEYFGGVTAEVLVDNQTEVISHRIGAAVEYNARYLEVAAHYGFQPRACRPRRARTKGKDERMVRYLT